MLKPPKLSVIIDQSSINMVPKLIGVFGTRKGVTFEEGFTFEEREDLYKLCFHFDEDSQNKGESEGAVRKLKSLSILTDAKLYKEGSDTEDALTIVFANSDERGALDHLPKFSPVSFASFHSLPKNKSFTVGDQS